MKRFASLDFLRGLAILIMICLHIISDSLDLDLLFSDIDNEPLINIVMLVVLPFLGGLAGFFLLTSAISNMVSMYKQLEKGMPANTLIVRQIIGGLLIVLFAMLCEGLIGYHGAWGQYIRTLSNPSSWESYANTILSRWNHFEAIHTIGWCVVFNGIIQGLLSRNDQWKNVPRLIKNYIIIGVITIVLTIPIWIGVSKLVPGYPWAKSPLSGQQIYMPQIGKDNFWYILASPFLAILAAPMEPLFPYLAVSCIGSIIGIVMSQPPERIPKNFVKKVLFIALFAFIVGAIGVVITVITVMDGAGFMQAVNLYKDISFHRHWFPDNFRVAYASYLNIFSWLWQFLVLTGFGTMFTMMVIYLVEWRGVGHDFGNFKSVRFVRRFGFTAFTNYNNQWYYILVWTIVAYLLTGVYKGKMLWDGVLLTVVLSLFAYYIIMKLWEKVGFIGSIEWMIGTIAFSLIPSKRDATKVEKKWYEKGKLDVENAFYKAEWIDVITPDEQYYSQKRDSQILAKIAKISLASIIFLPFNIFIMFMLGDVKKKEGDNPALKQATTLSLIGTIITVIFLVLCFTLTPKMVGFSLA
jgi:hypothetical protein